jgi:hypothetical protein
MTFLARGNWKCEEEDRREEGMMRIGDLYSDDVLYLETSWSAFSITVNVSSVRPQFPTISLAR